MTVKDIANLIPTMSAAALAADNLKGIPKRDGSGKGKRLNKGRGGCEIKEVVGKGMKNIVGLSLIRAQAGLVSGL